MASIKRKFFCIIAKMLLINPSFRAVALLVVGSLYSWSLGNEGKIGYPFNHCFTFVLTGFLALLTSFSVIFLPDKMSAPAIKIDSNPLADEDTAHENSHEVCTAEIKA